MNLELDHPSLSLSDLLKKDCRFQQIVYELNITILGPGPGTVEAKVYLVLDQILQHVKNSHWKTKAIFSLLRRPLLFAFQTKIHWTPGSP